MKSSDEIFQLIKSLSKQEKSYFKKFASSFKDEDGNNYLKLFDEIVSQSSKLDEYDEDKIKKGSYTGKFLKNLSFHKNYLYNMLLSSITHYHKENKDTIYLRNLISQSELLFDKLLYSQSLKVLLRAKKFAVETDKHSYLFDILNKEKVIYRYILNIEEFMEKVKIIFKEQYELLEILKNNLDYYCLNDSLGFFLSRLGTGFTRSKEELTELENFFSNPLLKDINKAKTFFNKTVFNTMNFQYYQILNEYDRAYYFIAENEKLWEENLNKTGGKLDNYIFAINNLLTGQIRTGRFDEFENTHRKMRGLEKKFPKKITNTNKVFIFYSSTILRISKCCEVLDTNGLAKIDVEVERELAKYESSISMYQRIIFYYFLGTSNFIRSNFEKTIYWMGKIINLEKTDLSQDYQCYARIVYLICYFELGYFDSLEYILKSTYHFISKRERVYKYENIILKYLRRSFRIKTESELKEMLNEMKHELEEIAGDDHEKNAFDAFDIIPWLESRLKNISVLQATSEKKQLTVSS